MSTVHVLVNPTAGRGHGSATLDAVTATMRRLGADPVVLATANRPAAIAGLRQAVDDGATRLVVIGGDGLVHLAIQVVASTKVVLAPIPTGTGNDFARALTISSRAQLDTAVERALGEPVPLDAIRTSHGWVASVATLGFAAAVNGRANALSWPRGRVRYSLATLLELPRLRPLPLRVTVDDVERDLEISLAAVANTAYFGGGMAICPEADPTDGRLDLALVDAVPRHALLRFFPSVFRGTHLAHPAVTVLSGRHIRLELAPDTPTSTRPTARTGEVWGDGEHLGPLPIELEAVPEALHIAGIAPKDQPTP